MPKATLPTPRDHLAVVTSNQRIYPIEGRVGGDFNRTLTSVEAYDPTADRWERVADLPTPRSEIAEGIIVREGPHFPQAVTVLVWLLFMIGYMFLVVAHPLAWPTAMSTRYLYRLPA